MPPVTANNDPIVKEEDSESMQQYLNFKKLSTKNRILISDEESESESNDTNKENGSISAENEEANTKNSFHYESYDEDDDNLPETSASNSAQYIEASQPARSRLPSNIIDYLHAKYIVNKYPNSDEIYQMSVETKLTYKKVKNWFDSTRFKLKHAKKQRKSLC